MKPGAKQSSTHMLAGIAHDGTEWKRRLHSQQLASQQGTTHLAKRPPKIAEENGIIFGTSTTVSSEPALGTPLEDGL